VRELAGVRQAQRPGHHHVVVRLAWGVFHFLDSVAFHDDLDAFERGMITRAEGYGHRFEYDTVTAHGHLVGLLSTVATCAAPVAIDKDTLST